MQPTIAITLTDEQAWAIAQFLKRVSLSHYQATNKPGLLPNSSNASA